MPVFAIAVGPTLLWNTLTFYLAHPDLRYELGTSAGLGRILRNDFSTGPTSPATGMD